MWLSQHTLHLLIILWSYSWIMLKYPMPKEKRAALVRIYFEVAVLPSMPPSTVNTAVEGLAYLVRSKKKLSIDNLRLPWKPVYKMLSRELFLSRRKFEIKYVDLHN